MENENYKESKLKICLVGELIMANGNINQNIRTKIKASPETVILALEEKGFCVGLLKNGKTVKKEARNVSAFSDLVRNSSIVWVDYVIHDTKKDVPLVAAELGFNPSLITNLLKNARSGYEDLDVELGMFLPAIIVSGFDVKLEPLFILIKDNIIVTLHTTEAKRFFRLRRYAETFMRKINIKSPAEDKITSILIRILAENNSRNFDHLREIEETADTVSEKLADPMTPRQIIGLEIHNMKHALISYLGGLWATVDVINTLRYGDPELLSNNPKLLDRLTALASEVNTHIGLGEHLSEVLASGLEVLQSIYNNQLQILNNKLALLVAYLTVIGTAVLVPNTLATVLGSDVFNLGPGDIWWYTALIVASTAFSVYFSYWWVKKAGLLPDKAHVE